MTAAPQSATEQVAERYATIARAALAESGDAPAGCCDAAGDECGARHYDADELAGLPAGVAGVTLGSGHPVRAAELQPGERVVDLGSGSGVDVLLAARAVGPDGHVTGVDATAEMVTLATRHATEAGAANVEFRHARMEALPLPDDSVDVVLSNCVLNLSGDKPAAFAEIARVLRGGGRLVASDLVADDALTPADRAERGTHAGCVAGALSFGEYRAELAAAGMVDIELTPEGSDVDGIHRTLVRARAPQRR